jgi:hypothetical protein
MVLTVLTVAGSLALTGATARAQGHADDLVEVQVRYLDFGTGANRSLDLGLGSSASADSVTVTSSVSQDQTAVFTVDRSLDYGYLHVTPRTSTVRYTPTVIQLWGDDLVPTASRESLSGLGAVSIRYAPVLPDSGVEPGDPEFVEVRATWDTEGAFRGRSGARIDLIASDVPWHTVGGQAASPSSGYTAVFTVPRTEEFRYLHAEVRSGGPRAVAKLWDDNFDPLVESVTLTDEEGRTGVLSVEIEFGVVVDDETGPIDSGRIVGQTGDVVDAVLTWDAEQSAPGTSVTLRFRPSPFSAAFDSSIYSGISSTVRVALDRSLSVLVRLGTNALWQRVDLWDFGLVQGEEDRVTLTDPSGRSGVLSVDITNRSAQQG